MLRRPPSLDVVRHELRAHVCSRCPRRSRNEEAPADLGGPRACEATCPVFMHLPALVSAAECRDPVVADRAETLRRRIARLRQGADATGSAPTRGTRNRAADVIARPIGG
jgi:hypothetical protein